MAGEGTGTKIVKWLMVIFNFVFFALGIGVLAMGILVRVKKSDLGQAYFTVAYENDSPWMDFGSLCIAVGVFVILVGGSGCLGALRMSKILLGVFIFLVVLSFALEIAAAVVGYKYRHKIDDDLRNSMNVTFARSMNSSATSGKKFKDAWDTVQKELKCCGVDGPSDYNGPPPPSCGQPPKITGCYKKVKDLFVRNWKTWTGVAAGVAAIQLLALIFAIHLCCVASSSDYTSV